MGKRRGRISSASSKNSSDPKKQCPQSANERNSLFQHIINADRTAGDHTKTPFIGTFQFIENHHSNLYGCAFNPFVKPPNTAVAAVVGSNFIHLYQFPPNEPTITRANTVRLGTSDELYCVSWAYDEMGPARRKHKIITGGETGRIYVMDGATMEFDRMLLGHNGSIHDIRTCPINPALIATCSKDHTIRLFHIREQTCLLIFAGRFGHIDSVVSVDWSADASMLVSCGFDHKILGWSFERPEISNHINTCVNAIKAGKSIKNILAEQPFVSNKYWLGITNLEGHSLIAPMPTHSVHDVHFNCVDTIRTVEINGITYFVSKATGHESQINLWRFGTYKEKVNELKDTPNVRETGPAELNGCQTILGNWTIEDGFPWYGRLEIDPLKKWIVAVGSQGSVHFYDMHNIGRGIKSNLSISANPKLYMNRQAAFSPGGRQVLVVGDQGFVARFDRVPASAGDNIHDVWVLGQRA